MRSLESELAGGKVGGGCDVLLKSGEALGELNKEGNSLTLGGAEGGPALVKALPLGGKLGGGR